jgi:HEPN domain-containing protein
VALAQQAVEKMLKAALAARGVYPDTHEVSEPFRSVFSDLPDVDRLADIASRMEDIGVRSRYPLFRRADLPIWIPSERLGAADSERALDGATVIFHAISAYLADAFGVCL